MIIGSVAAGRDLVLQGVCLSTYIQIAGPCDEQLRVCALDGMACHRFFFMFTHIASTGENARRKYLEHLECSL